MKPLIFVDSSALIAVGNTRDQFYQPATQLFRKLLYDRRYFVTTTGVILEVANTFSMVSFKPVAWRLIEQIQASSRWTIISIDEALLNRGLARFRQFKDKDWSLVDCISMVVANDMKINEIFTNDHHFEQAGFIRLLR